MKKIIFSLSSIAVLIVCFFILKEPAKEMMYPLKYKSEVFKYSDEFSVPAPLIFAVIKTESGFDPDAVSHKGARGLMQITEDTFNWAKAKNKWDEEYEDIFDPNINIKYGTFILSFLIDDFQNEETALASYNAGRGNVRKWLKDEEYSKDGETLFYIPFKETREYVVKVQNNKEAYLINHRDVFK